MAEFGSGDMRYLVAEFVDGQPEGGVYTARDFILYAFLHLLRGGGGEAEAAVAVAATEIKRRHRELRDPQFAAVPYLIHTYREDHALAATEYRLVRRGRLRPRRR